MYLILYNIPEKFRSRDLRNFFSIFVEKKAFNCFHFCHRPQSQLVDLVKRSSSNYGMSEGDVRCCDDSDTQVHSQRRNGTDSKPLNTLTVEQSNADKNDPSTGTQETKCKEGTGVESETNVENDRKGGDDSCTHVLSSGPAAPTPLTSKMKWKKYRQAWPKRAGRTCGVMNIKDELEEAFLNMYNHKHWVTREGNILEQRCYLLRVVFQDQNQSDAGNDHKKQDMGIIDQSPHLPRELKPGPVMLQGNVGTPKQHFQNLVQAGEIRRNLIMRLGLESLLNSSKKKKKKKKSEPDPCHNETLPVSQEDTQTEREEGIAVTASGHLIPSSVEFEEIRRERNRKGKGIQPKDSKMELEKPENGAEMEEMIHSEALPGDTKSLECIKERAFEEELEVLWEKDVFGVVFYTTAELWYLQEGVDDEITSNMCDADIHVYCEKGDKDVKDGLEMRTSDEMNAGSHQQFVTKKKGSKQNRGKKRKAAGSVQKSASKRKNEEDIELLCGSKEDRRMSKMGDKDVKDGLEMRTSDEMNAGSHQQFVTKKKGSKQNRGKKRKADKHRQAGNKNARDGLEMRTSTNLKADNLREYLYKWKKEGKGSPRGEAGSEKRKTGPMPPPTVGSFEAHSKGFGRRLMESQGWKEGQGLGARAGGIPYALEVEGQHPYKRIGFGYHE